MMPKYSEIERWLWAEVARAVDVWMREQSRNVFERYYLDYQRGALELHAGTTPAGWQLGWQERIPANLTRDQAIVWVIGKARSLQCLPVNDAGEWFGK